MPSRDPRRRLKPPPNICWCLNDDRFCLTNRDRLDIVVELTALNWLIILVDVLGDDLEET